MTLPCIVLFGMEILSTSDENILKASKALSAGLLVAFPTETVYGLGADAFNPAALARIFEAKNRPRFDPLIIHIAELGALPRIADTSAMDKEAREKLTILSEKLWPGPLTFVLPKLKTVPALATAGLETAAIRFPSHPVAQKLIRLSTGAIAAPSANAFGCLSPTRAEHVKAQLGERVDFIIDGGRTEVGLESTVLDLSANTAGGTPRILRPGGTPREAIEALIGPVEFCIGASRNGVEKPVSPGQLKSHYAPTTPLILHKYGELSSLPETPGEGRLYFSYSGKFATPERTRALSKTGNLAEAASNLFDMLHDLDRMGLRLIRAEEAPGGGLGEAINDRLRRAGSR